MSKDYLEELLERLTEYFEPYEDEGNIKPSEALECLENMYTFNEDSIYQFDQEYNIIKQALLKAQEDKIIADFIREHYKLSNDINKNYLVLKKPIAEEEDIKFKENL